MKCAPQRVDVVMALDLLAACVRSFPPGAASPRDDGPLLVDAALAQLGVTIDEVAISPIVLEGCSEPPTAGTQFTIGAVVALRSARRAERCGATWEHALRAARRNVVRLLEVVPQAVFDAATAERCSDVT